MKVLFSQEQAFEAADALAAEGKDVSVLSLQAKLGGGSFTTMQKYLTAWKDARQQKAIAASAMALPESVQAAISSSLANVWRVAGAEAAREIAQIKEKASAEVAEANKQFDEAFQAVERLELEAINTGDTLAKLTKLVAELEAKSRTLENENSALKAIVEQQNKHINSNEAELVRVHTDSDNERKRLRTEMEHSRNEAERQRQQLLDDLATMKKDITSLQEQSLKETSELREKLNESKLQAEHYLVERDEATKRANQAEELRIAATKEREEVIIKSAELSGKVDVLSNQLDTIRQKTK